MTKRLALHCSVVQIATEKSLPAGLRSTRVPVGAVARRMREAGIARTGHTRLPSAARGAQLPAFQGSLVRAHHLTVLTKRLQSFAPRRLAPTQSSGARRRRPTTMRSQCGRAGRRSSRPGCRLARSFRHLPAPQPTRIAQAPRCLPPQTRKHTSSSRRGSASRRGRPAPTSSVFAPMRATMH